MDGVRNEINGAEYCIKGIEKQSTQVITKTQVELLGIKNELLGIKNSLLCGKVCNVQCIRVKPWKGRTW